MRQPYASIASSDSIASSAVTVTDPSRKPITTDHTRNATTSPRCRVRRVLGQETSAAAVFAARGEALQAAQQQQQYRCRDSDRVVAGYQADSRAWTATSAR